MLNFNLRKRSAVFCNILLYFKCSTVFENALLYFKMSYHISKSFISPLDWSVLSSTQRLCLAIINRTVPTLVASVYGGAGATLSGAPWGDRVGCSAILWAGAWQTRRWPRWWRSRNVTKPSSTLCLGQIFLIKPR